MEKSMAEVMREAESLPKFRGWEIRGTREENYKPEKNWEPFAVTTSAWGIVTTNAIWCRREIWK